MHWKCGKLYHLYVKSSGDQGHKFVAKSGRDMKLKDHIEGATIKAPGKRCKLC